jgi:hypothetical protein
LTLKKNWCTDNDIAKRYFFLLCRLLLGNILVAIWVSLSLLDTRKLSTLAGRALEVVTLDILVKNELKNAIWPGDVYCKMCGQTETAQHIFFRMLSSSPHGAARPGGPALDH